ncbi:MAG: extracellular solute-binding protein [Planctomycetota bacterium]
MRYILGTLLALTILSPFVMRLFVDDGSPEIEATGETARLVIVTPHNPDIRREFAEAFDRWHRENFNGQAVLIDYRVPGGTTQITRLLDKTYSVYVGDDGKLAPPDEVNADLDVVWGGGDFVFNVELKNLIDGQSVLQGIEIDPELLAAAYPQEDIAGIRLFDASEPPQWFGVCLSSFGIVYSPDLVEVLGVEHNPGEPAISTWDGLGDAKLFGTVALADPSKSGSAAVTYMMVIQRKMQDAVDAVGGDESDEVLAAGWADGMRLLTRIAANSRYFTDSASQVPHDVAQADAAAGMAIDFYGGVYVDQVGPERIQFVRPNAATAITPDPVAVLYGVKGEKRELAKRFVEFLLTPEAQRLWIKKVGTEDGPRVAALWRPPIRKDIYAELDPETWTNPTNPFADVGGFNQRSDWMREFSEIRMMWSAAWIDAAAALESAAHRIMDMQDEARRDALLDQLAGPPEITVDVPGDETADITLDRPGLLRLREVRKAVSADDAMDVGEWKAETRIKIAEAYRAHYRSVAEKAE